MNIKDWSPEMCIAHLTLHGWVPRTQGVFNRGLRNGLATPDHKYFYYEWGGGIDFDRADRQTAIGWDHSDWYMFSTADLWLFMEKCDEYLR